MNKLWYKSLPLFVVLLSCFGTATAEDESSFSAQQREEIGQIAARYLVAHPEYILEAANNLKKKQDEALQEKRVAGVLANSSTLLQDPSTPVVGPANGTVSVIEFFDYQCIYCAKSFPVISAVMKKHPDVRYVFKEFPIFGTNWPASNRAAEMGLAIWKTQGAQAYMKYHDGLYATGHNEGKLTDGDIAQVMQSNSIAVPAPSIIADMAAVIRGNQELATKLGIQGTPMFIVMPTQGVSKDTLTVVPGLISEDVLTAAILKASSAK